MECYDSKGNLNNYECTYTVNTSYGHYVWCGRGNGKPGQWKISPGHTNFKDTHMIRIDFKLNYELAHQTQLIEVFDESWSLIGYNVQPIKSGQWTMVRPINPNLTNRELTVLFLQNRELTLEEKARLKANPLMRLPKNKIYSIKVKVPNLTYKQPSQEDVCCSCLEKSKPDQSVHITSCSHKIHNSCLFDWFKLNNLVSGETCPCCQTQSVQLAKCPVCNSFDLTHGYVQV